MNLHGCGRSTTTTNALLSIMLAGVKMPQTIASDMARKSFGALLERVERQGSFSPEEAQELLASCEIGSMVLERLWRLAQGCLDRGMESKKLTFLVKEFMDVIELAIKTFGTARERAKVAGLTPDERAEGLSSLELQGQRAAEMHNELSALLRWLQKPAKTLGPLTLPADRGDREAEGYVDLNDLTARLLSHGDA
jgi:hypothetical protein